MKHIAAYLLLQIGGNASPTTKDITRLLATVGIDPDADRLDKLISELKGKSINDLIAEGSSQLSSVPSGGTAVASSGGAGAGGGGAPAVEEAKVEEKPEEKEESDDDMGFGLFD